MTLPGALTTPAPAGVPDEEPVARAQADLSDEEPAPEARTDLPDEGPDQQPRHDVLDEEPGAEAHADVPDEEPVQEARHDLLVEEFVPGVRADPPDEESAPEPHADGARAVKPETVAVGETPELSGAKGSPEAYGAAPVVVQPDPGIGDAEPEPPGLKTALEAILLVVDEPVAEVTLAQVLERPTHEVTAALRELAEEYTAGGRGFDLRQIAGGWRYYTRATCAPLVERFVRDGQQTRLTQAALETLAVVAYRQPVSRARVAAVRGVNSDGVMRTLVARGLVEEAGTDPEGQAVLYRTSSYFLERLGLTDLSELPELAPFLPDDVENLEETTK